MKVTDKDIEEAVIDGAITFEDVQKKTKVGIQDKSCIPEVEQLIKFYREKYFGAK
jgi:bacterioferritin-associated ferredoxin